MEYVTLNNNLKMPLLGLGTWDLRNEECIQTVAKAIQLGYRLIDTAQMYGNEKEVGLGIMKSGVPREQLFITTKMYRISNSYKMAKKAIEESLKKLNVDYIDLYLLHEPYKEGIEMYKALEEAYKEGKVRAIGISNYDEKWYQSFIKQCKIIPMVNQVETHLFYQKWNFQKLLEKNKTAMQAWAPLAQGKDHIFNNFTLINIGKKYNKTAAQVILRFLTQRGISVIPKSSKEERLIENMSIFDFKLNEEEVNQIKKLDRNDTLFAWTRMF